jgi:17beta-estradiol 17-dehydrogenase / very-long-chain 3-oxoacyl-CoA reductase
MFILLLLLASTVFTLCMLVEGATYLYTMLFQRLNLSAYKRSNANVWAIVTGANHGIGLAFARKLAECGFNVLLHGRNQEKLTAIKEELHRKFPNLHFQTVVADATDISEANIMRVVHACHDKDVAILHGRSCRRKGL